MSKIICEVCGTAYPETATQCPICGCVRPVNSQGAAGNAHSRNSGSTYQYTKGGRFSKKNVKKRNQAAYVPVSNTTANKMAKKQSGDKTTKGLVITAIVLVLAIVAVAAYICLKFFAPDFLDDPQQLLPQDTNAAVDSEPTTLPQAQIIHCTAVSLDVNQVILSTLGEARVLNVTTEPSDTTDVISFVSDNEAVATVTSNGKVTAVGPGRANITVVCGEVSASCIVECTYVPEEETTAPTTEATVPEEEFMLNRSDITFSKQGESWVVYSGKIAKTDITWSTDNSNVATIDNGKIVAVGSGTTKIHAEYNGTKVSCIIRCNFSSGSENQGVSGNGGVSEDGG